jgi:putative spermidine/putrescine transport system ATP-binding protein
MEDIMTNIPLPITLTNIRKYYDNFEALPGINLDVAPCEFLTLLGPSGSGKTTLLMILAGFERPTEGKILVNDVDITTLPPHKRDIGMVFQNYALFPHMSVAENVAYPLRRRRVSKAVSEDKVRAALDVVQLVHLADRKPDQLSGGQKQRIALARAIVFEPKILLMDEPLSALDKKLREQMQIEIRHLHDRLGITTIYVTHDQREALTMSDRIAVLNQGRIAQLDAPETIYNAPANAFVADFVGESTALKVQMAGGKAHLGDTVLRAESVSVLGSETGGALLIVRPEKIEIVDPKASNDDLNLMHGTLKEIVYQGDTFLAEIIMSDGQSLLVRRATRAENFALLPEPGEALTLGLRQDDTILVPEDAA